MTVDEYAELLLNSPLELVEDGFYRNRAGQQGYRAIYRGAGTYYWYSVSATDVSFAPDEVSLAISHPQRGIRRENRYFNRNFQLGFEATVSAGEHCFMLNAAPDFPAVFI